MQYTKITLSYAAGANLRKRNERAPPAKKEIVEDVVQHTMLTHTNFCNAGSSEKPVQVPVHFIFLVAVAVFSVHSVILL